MSRALSRARLGLALALLTGASAGAQSLEVAVTGAAEAPAPRAATVEVAAGTDGPAVKTVAVPGTVRFDVPAGATVRVTVTAEGHWAPPRVVHVAGARTMAVRLRPTGWISGTVGVPVGETPPEEIEARVRSAPGMDEELAESRQRCDVTEGAFRCEVPHGDLDVRLRAKGFVSHHLWGLEVPPRGTASVGVLKLRPGASVVGWVEAPSRDFRFDRLEVRLAPIAAGLAETATDRQRVETLVQRAGVSSRGFFELASVPPGSYEVTVHHPDYAPARIAPVVVMERAESEIHRVELSVPALFEAKLFPATDPFHRPWQVELHERGEVPGHLDLVAEGASSREGTWSAGGLAAGEYVLGVRDSRGSRWLWDEVTVAPSMPPHDARLPAERLEGTLRLGGEPLAATLYFGGRQGVRRIPVRSDEDGKFYVFLPRQEEPWVAQIVEPEIGLDRLIGDIEVRKLPGAPWAKVEIDLPDTVVFGEVVDEEGQPLIGAAVDAIDGEGKRRSSVSSGEPDGEFELAGLEPGRWRIEAWYRRGGRRLSSESLEVEVGDRDGSEMLQLVLREESTLSGLVLSPDGQGVPGAKVVARIDRSERPLLGMMPSAMTDVDGVFELDLPHGAGRTIVSVLAPGFTVKALSVDARREDPLIVELEQAGGTVIVSYEGGEAIKPILLRNRTDLFNPHLVAHSWALRQWSELHGHSKEDRSYAVPMLEPGPYTACYDVGYGVLSSGWLPAGGLPDRCASGVLSPYGELHLTVRVPETTSSLQP